MKSHETHDLQRVYDIMDAGPNHRFTANGKLVGNSDGINLQNLSSGRKEGQTDLLRRSIIAYDGYVVVNYDSSQIELRTNCYVGNQTDMLAVFKTGGDPYVATASDIYGEPAETILHAAKVLKDPQAIYKRQVGKTAALGLGYGMGWAKFQTTALTNAGISLTAEEAKHITRVFRNKMTSIVGLWKQCDAALETMVNRHQWQFGGPNGDLFFVDGNRHLFGAHVPGIRLPNGMWLNYPGLTIKDKDGKPNFCFSKMRYNGKTSIESWVYGAKITENIVQALAFAIMKWQGLQIAQYYPVKMNTHDEWVAVVPRAQAEEAAAFMEQVMNQAPSWVEGLPLGSEGGWAESYGEVDIKWSKDHPDNPNHEYRFDPTTGQSS